MSYCYNTPNQAYGPISGRPIGSRPVPKDFYQCGSQGCREMSSRVGAPLNYLNQNEAHMVYPVGSYCASGAPYLGTSTISDPRYYSSWTPCAGTTSYFVAPCSTYSTSSACGPGCFDHYSSAVEAYRPK